MLTKTLRIEDDMLVIPELERFRGKIVEITVKEKQSGKKRLKKFFSLCGKISLDESETERLREISKI